MCLPKRCQIKAAAIAEALLQAELDGFFLMAQKCNFRNTGLNLTFLVSCCNYRFQFWLGLACVIVASRCSQCCRVIALPGRTVLLGAPICWHHGGTGSHKPWELPGLMAVVGSAGHWAEPWGSPTFPRAASPRGGGFVLFACRTLI